MKLIVGLGNYPHEYNNTRHNVGFMVVDAWLQKHDTFLDKNEFNGWFRKFSNQKGESYIIAKPYTYVNLSGQFVEQIVSFYKIDYNDILIICDDVDTKIGKFRVKQTGSSGGQKGLQNIIDLMSHTDIKRVRVGIGRPIDKSQMIPHVLGKFTSDELNVLNPVIESVTNLIDDFIDGLDFQRIASKYNH